MEMEGDKKRETRRGRGVRYFMLQINLFSTAYNYVVSTRAMCLQECIKLAQHATAIFKHGSWMLISEYGRETAWSWEVVFVGS